MKEFNAMTSRTFEALKNIKCHPFIMCQGPELEIKALLDKRFPGKKEFDVDSEWDRLIYDDEHDELSDDYYLRVDNDYDEQRGEYYVINAEATYVLKPDYSICDGFVVNKHMQRILFFDYNDLYYYNLHYKCDDDDDDTCSTCSYTAARQQFTASAAALFESMRESHRLVMTDFGPMILVPSTIVCNPRPMEWTYTFRLVDARMIEYRGCLKTNAQIGVDLAERLIAEPGTRCPRDRMDIMGIYNPDATD